MSLPDSFAFFDHESCSWRTCQVCLLPDSESSFPIWPKQGMTAAGFAFALPTSGRLTDASAFSSSPPTDDEPTTLLPTPNAYESTPTDEYVQEMREHLDPEDPNHRLWLPGRRWMAQRTLSRLAPALLGDQEQEAEPTSEGPEAAASEARLLPTPVVTDSFGSRRSTARTEDWVSHPGTSLTDAIWETQGRTEDTQGNLLPTPRASDGNGLEPLSRELHRDKLETRLRRLPTPTARLGRDNGGGAQAKRYLNPDRSNDLDDAIKWLGEQTADEVELLPTPTTQDAHNNGGQSQQERRTPPLNAVVPLLPTPVANPDNPGAGGELRAALTHGPERRNETGTDTMGRPNLGRPSRALLPTPQKADGDGGRIDSAETVLSGKRPSGAKASVSLREAITYKMEDAPLLPTPRVHASRSSRHAMVDVQQWAAPSLEQALELAEGILPREFESWDEVPGWMRNLDPSTGASTDPQSQSGNTSSDAQLPLQLTIGDDSSRDSSSGCSDSPTGTPR